MPTFSYNDSCFIILHFLYLLTTVISGQDVVSAIEQVGSDQGKTRVPGKFSASLFDEMDKPIDSYSQMKMPCLSTSFYIVTIADCGQLR
jgi:hypothetical protein